VTRVAQAATSDLPDPSLGIPSGGTIATKQDDRSGTQTTEHIFKVRIEDFDVKPDDDKVTLPDVRAKQRMVVRFNLGQSPLMFQWWRQLRQLVQRRFTTML
jgi:putative peptide zinc metalloprotease protein